MRGWDLRNSSNSLYYWVCSRHQAIMGKYPQPIREVLRRPEDIINPFDTCNIWDGEVRMGVIDEIRRRINKIRWERWRAKQNKELEKSYFYARGEWNQWGNWSDVPSEKCGCDECPKVAAVKEQTTISEEFEAHEDLPPGRAKEFLLEINPDTGEYWRRKPQYIALKYDITNGKCWIECH